MSKDLLKEAIADAKAVRETAIANAKLALEEAFMPRIQSMLSAKLAEEMEDEAELEEEDGYMGDATPDEGPALEEEGYDEAEVEEAEVEEGMYEAEEDELDLESIIRELEDGEDEVEAEPVAEAEDEEEMHEAEDEEVDVNEIIRSLREEEEAEAEEEVEVEEEPAATEDDLEEAYRVIRFLKSKINEVNLLNAKLLFSNKLFRNFDLNESQKFKVINTFDRTNSLREVKLVYSTLCESFNIKGKKQIKESYASKPAKSTKPSTSILTEGNELAARWQKLAGLKK